MIIESLYNFMQKVMLFTAYINTNGSFPHPLSAKEEEEYFLAYKNGDQKAKDILVQHNLRLVAHVVKKYASANEADDLISVGSLGLIKAINTYKLESGTQLSTYAAKCIENEILMLIRQNKKHKNTVSVEDILSYDDEDNEMSLKDIIFEDSMSVEDMIHEEDVSNKLKEVLNKALSKREYDIICMRYGFDGYPVMTQREVANKLGISRSYISRLEKKSILTLKNIIKKQDYR